MRAVRPWPSPTVLLPYFAAGAFEVSRFSCMKFLGVSGVSDYAGLSSGSRLGAQYPAHLCPCLRFAVHLAVPQRKTRGRADRYSFPVRLLHSLLHAGLSRRTRIALLHHRCGSVPVHHTHQSLPSKMQSSESSGENLRLLTGQSFLIFLLYGFSAVVKRQRGGVCRDAAMYGGFSHCLTGGGTFPEDDVLPPVPDR